MRAVIWEAPGQLAVTEAADPVPGHGELVVRVGACGICGTDLHIADGEFPPTPYPIIPGHEFAGRVVALGPGVPAGWREGERVAVDPSLFCGYCQACRGGRGNLCANWNAIGDTVNGAFAEYVAVPAANAYRIPDGVSDAQGALIEPLSCAVHGLRRIGPVIGEHVLLTGAGTMGLLLLQLLSKAGAATVSVVDRKSSRLQAAKALGAVAVAEDVSALDRRVFGVAVDATGVPAAIEACFRSLDRGGRLLIFGVANGDAMVSLSPFRIYNDE
ncbi:MAG: alcohol dehydrogenase catalytic domain-containing protein, partial [Trebonia sp.]